MNKHVFLVVVISFVLVFSGLSNAQNSAPPAGFISRVTGVIWEGDWFNSNDPKERNDQHTEMEIKPDGTLIYNFVKNKTPGVHRYVVEEENTFSFTLPNGQKLTFVLKVNDKGGDALHGHMAAHPRWKIIMTKKKS